MTLLVTMVHSDPKCCVFRVPAGLNSLCHGYFATRLRCHHRRANQSASAMTIVDNSSVRHATFFVQIVS
jgi:hypothetical protein